MHVSASVTLKGWSACLRSETVVTRAGSFILEDWSGEMGLMYEKEIRGELAVKLAGLRDLHRDLVARVGADPLPPEDALKALDQASAAVKDCVVCQENHASGLIPLAAETLGETFLVLREVETVIRDVMAGLLVAAESPTASQA
jgi:hypothetical protein